MCNRDEFERIFKSVFKGHKMTRGSNDDYISIVPWAAWKVWQEGRAQGVGEATQGGEVAQGQSLATVVLNEEMTEGFKAQWRNGLPLDSAEAKWAFCGWQAARAQGGEAEPKAWVSSALYGSKLTFQKPDPPEGWEDYADDWYCYPLYTHPSASVPDELTEKALELCRAVENGEEFPPAKFALRCLMLVNQIRRLAATPQPADNWIYREPDHGEEDYCGQVWTLDRNGEVELLSTEDCIAEFMSGDEAEIIAFQPTGLKRPNPPSEGKE